MTIQEYNSINRENERIEVATVGKVGEQSGERGNLSPWGAPRGSKTPTLAQGTTEGR